MIIAAAAGVLDAGTVKLTGVFFIRTCPAKAAPVGRTSSQFV